MAESVAERAAAVQQILNATANSAPEIQQKAMEALALPEVVPDPTQAVADSLWKILVLGLLILLAIALAGLLYTVADGDADTSPDLIIAAFSSLLAGLIALFVKSPVDNEGS